MADDGFWIRMLLRAVCFTLAAVLSNGYFMGQIVNFFSRLRRKP